VGENVISGAKRVDEIGEVTVACRATPDHTDEEIAHLVPE
jgi:hypothetical protein